MHRQYWDLATQYLMILADVQGNTEVPDERSNQNRTSIKKGHFHVVFT